MVELGLLVVLPMVWRSPALRPGRRLRHARKRPPSTLAQCGILLMVPFGAVNPG
jgi:hypothetical protein